MSTAEGTGTVLEAGGGVYRIAMQDGTELDASLRGRLKREIRGGDRVVVGDEVLVRIPESEGATIEKVSPRRTELLRRALNGRKAKVVAANVDQALVVVAAKAPDPRRELVDRFLALTATAGIPPVLLVNKVDLPGAPAVAADLKAFYGSLGFQVLPISAVSGEGLDAARDLLAAGRSVIVGPSGVGKSSLLNALNPGLALRTGGLSERRGTGRHTTVGGKLVRLEPSGEVVDTPGFSEAALWEVEPAELARAFPEFDEPSGYCRFRGCSHIHEPGCGVREALDEGEIDAERYASYRRLLAEALEQG